MKTSLCSLKLSALICVSFLTICGCCLPEKSGGISETPRLVDYVAKGNDGETLFESYKGERMFTFSYLTNNAGARVTSVYCGYPSDSSLVHRRLYGVDGKIVRIEAIMGSDPMVLKLEIYDPVTENCVHAEWITQGEARRHSCDYCRQNGISAMDMVGVEDAKISN